MPEGIRPSSDNKPVHEPGGAAPSSPTGDPMQEAMNTKVATLGQLKKVLIDHLGEKKGMKLYNLFLKNLALSMLSQMRQAQAGADAATKSMRQTS